MASIELLPFKPCRDIQIIAALDLPTPSLLQLGFWVTDPLQQIIWTPSVHGQPRRDGLWQQTCFELFIGVRGEDFYRELNFSPSGAWQAYAFEEYRYPETTPPQPAHDLELVHLQRTHFGLTASLDLTLFLQHHQIRTSQLYFGLCAVVDTPKNQHLFALAHSQPQADFHNKHDWKMGSV